MGISHCLVRTQSSWRVTVPDGEGPDGDTSHLVQCSMYWCFHTRARQQDNDKTNVEPVHSYDAFHTRFVGPGVKGIIGMHLTSAGPGTLRSSPSSIHQILATASVHISWVTKSYLKSTDYRKTVDNLILSAILWQAKSISTNRMQSQRLLFHQ